MNREKKDLYKKIAIAVVTCLAAGAAGAVFTETGEWYQNLNKPGFNPPSWVFAPVWTTLYILIGVAAGKVWHQGIHIKKVKKAMIFFFIQLVLNALWPYSFFGLHSPLIGLINILLLEALIIITVILFYKVKPAAAWLLIPYLLWVTYATILNASIVSLN